MCCSLLAVLLLLAAPALQRDQIVLVNGRVLQDVRVTSETYKEVVYKTGSGQEGRKPAQEVKQVEHDLGPALLDDYVRALELMDSLDWQGAISTFNEVLADARVLQKYEWVVQHAIYRQARCHYALNDAAGVGAAVDTLLAKDPDTFFYAPALLMKAEVLTSAGDAASARKVYEQLDAAVRDLGLPERWARESELGLTLLDTSLKGQARQRRLQQLVDKNKAQYPTVANRANMEQGNALLLEKDYAGAERFFQSIVDSGAADDWTEAAAHSGLGETFYQRGLAEEDPAKAKEFFLAAALSHLRVVLMHKEVSTLVPQSVYYAADALDRRQDEASRRQARYLQAYLKKFYPRSSWNGKLEERFSGR